MAWCRIRDGPCPWLHGPPGTQEVRAHHHRRHRRHCARPGRTPTPPRRCRCPPYRVRTSSRCHLLSRRGDTGDPPPRRRRPRRGGPPCSPSPPPAAARLPVRPCAALHASSPWTTTPAMQPTRRCDPGGRSWERWGCSASLPRRHGRRGRSLRGLCPWSPSCALACPLSPSSPPKLFPPLIRPLTRTRMTWARTLCLHPAPVAILMHLRVLHPPLPGRLLAVDRLAIFVGLVVALAASRPSSDCACFLA